MRCQSSNKHLRQSFEYSRMVLEKLDKIIPAATIAFVLTSAIAAVVFFMWLVLVVERDSISLVY